MLRIYEAKVFGSCLGVGFLNKYVFMQQADYNNATSYAGADAIRNMLQTAYVALRAGLSEDWTTSTIEVMGDDGVGFLSGNFVHAGSLIASGATLAPHIGCSVKFNRPSPTFRHGLKRFCGLLESQVGGRALNTGGTLNAPMAAFVTAMLVGTAGVGTEGVLKYCQVHRSVNGQPLPREVWQMAPFTAGALQLHVSTQNTRKG